LKAKGRKRAKNARQLTSPIWTPSDPINGDLWASQHDYAVRTIFEAPRSQAGYGIKISDRDLKAAVNLVAVANGFHPVREYLDSLKWDGVPRADDMFSRWLGAEDSAYSRSISRLTLLGAVVRVFEPGHKFDFVPILEGLQGKRKSTFIRVLARGFFSEIEGQFDDRKQMVEKMQGSWILELPELQGFGRHEVQTIKAFVSTQSDKVRLAWETRAKQYHRQCIFIGSTNDGQYLRDDTGGRRFWPIACGIEEIDTDGFEAEVDQIWAEARVAYREMRAAQPTGTLPLYITDAEAKAEALAKQEDRRVLNADDELAGDLAKWLDKPISDPSDFDEDEDIDIMGSEPPKLRNSICGLEVWCEMLGREKSHYLQAQAQHVGRALRKLPGWYKCSLADTKYGRQMVFRRKGSGFG
jgi:predicted P-loop ATPase